MLFQELSTQFIHSGILFNLSRLWGKLVWYRIKMSAGSKNFQTWKVILSNFSKNKRWKWLWSNESYLVSPVRSHWYMTQGSINFFSNNENKIHRGCFLKWDLGVSWVREKIQRWNVTLGEHSITTWTRWRGAGGNQVSTIIHVREGGGLWSVHMDNVWKKDFAFWLLHWNFEK